MNAVHTYSHSQPAPVNEFGDRHYRKAVEELTEHLMEQADKVVGNKDVAPDLKLQLMTDAVAGVLGNLFSEELVGVRGRLPEEVWDKDVDDSCAMLAKDTEDYLRQQVASIKACPPRVKALLFSFALLQVVNWAPPALRAG